MIKTALLFFLSLFLLFSGTACKEVKKRPTPSGINVMIHDMACEEVKDRLIAECKNHNFLFEWADKDRGILLIGPLTTLPLSEDFFAIMEEKFKLEIKCIDPISTRISVQIELKGRTAENQWLEIKDPDKLNDYTKRLLDRIINQ